MSKTTETRTRRFRLDRKQTDALVKALDKAIFQTGDDQAVAHYFRDVLRFHLNQPTDVLEATFGTSYEEKNA